MCALVNLAYKTLNINRITKIKNAFLFKFKKYAATCIYYHLHSWYIFMYRFGSFPIAVLCLLCDQNLVEEEYHFLCQCPLYQVERRTLCYYIPNFESLVPNEQFIKLMIYETTFLAKYVENYWS